MRGEPEVSGMPEVILDSFASRDNNSWRFSGLEETISAATPAEIVPALERVEHCVAEGFHAAGFVSYEAASGLSGTHATRPPDDFPLIRFGIFRERHAAPEPSTANGSDGEEYVISDPEFSLSEDAYGAAVERIREYIAAGDTYQVNFTMRQRFRFRGDEKSFYHDLCRSQRAPYCAFIDLGRHCVLSASPELFFRMKDGIITTRPMKGTAKRGRWPGEDSQIVRNFRTDAKEQAENLMIVDLLRNDMGIVSETGSVGVTSLFEVETLETIHQMTSTITSRLRPETRMVELFRALFPCGSITGAPKRRTMEIIAELEDSPRNIYTGCIGYISPGPEAVFSVAIRTVVIDREKGTGELGLGSGITWDSRPRAEYDECLAKGRFALAKVPDFRLLESLLFDQDAGYFLLERHMNRLAGSAGYFGFAVDISDIREALEQHSLPLTGSHKVRLLLSRNGSFTIQSEPVYGKPANGTVAVAFAGTPVDSANVFLYHKTDNRSLYTAELAKRPDCADVVFLNERGEVTEGANNNIVVRIGGELFTPPLDSGLLPGTFREELIETGLVRERVITGAELAEAEEIFLINSVRKWLKARLARQ
jgi:para-aminobenzoate synthetase/4-amino-4-deoxychorismate lyase